MYQIQVDVADDSGLVLGEFVSEPYNLPTMASYFLGEVMTAIKLTKGPRTAAPIVYTVRIVPLPAEGRV